MTIDHSQSEIWEQLAAAYYGLVPLRAFEQWVYATDALEGTIGRDGYLTLISQDYGSKYVTNQVCACVEALYLGRPSGELRSDAARWVCRRFLAGSLDLATTASTLGRFWSEDAPWARSEFAYISSELDEMIHPDAYARWEPAALALRLAEQDVRLRAFNRAAIDAAREIQRALQVNPPAF
jgi:hypothetical protein